MSKTFDDYLKEAIDKATVKLDESGNVIADTEGIIDAVDELGDALTSEIQEAVAKLNHEISGVGDALKRLRIANEKLSTLLPNSLSKEQCRAG